MVKIARKIASSAGYFSTDMGTRGIFYRAIYTYTRIRHTDLLLLLVVVVVRGCVSAHEFTADEVQEALPRG